MNSLFVLVISSAGLLLPGLLTLVAVAWLFWPRKGGLAWLRRITENNERAMLEDALKYLFDCEYRGRLCDRNGIARTLGISPEKATRLLTKLLEMGLAQSDKQAVILTETGRSYALRVVRMHRIWERYFADETSMKAADWHNEACRIEHRVTEEDTERLAAQMGHPIFDPHGDPIPTADGKLPKPAGVPLNELTKGTAARIIHLEDEPKSIYEQLVVLGLYPGMQVYLTEANDHKITFAADGDQCSLTPLFAAQVTVLPLSEKEIESRKYEPLSALEIGESAEVMAISPNCRGQQRRRLMDMGIVPGSRVSAVIKSASGDPTGYRVLGTTVGIRTREADLIFIKRINEAS